MHPDATVFSMFDAYCGYWQVGLDEDSSKVCTFNTPWGRYRFIRLPLGVNTSADIFNRIMTQIFQGMEGVEVVVDDIMVH